MTITAKQRLTNAYNEFVRDFMDDHGWDGATSKEALDIAERSLALGRAVYALSNAFGSGSITSVSDLVLDAICDSADDIDWIDRNIAALAVAAAIEESAQ